MVFLKFVFFVLLGAVLGFILTVAAGYPLLVALEGGRDINGGIAMGVFFQLGPIGALVGGLAAMILTAVSHRGPEDKKKPASRKTGPIILGGIIALAFGYFLLLAYVKGPAPISLAEADVQFEVRTPANSVSEADGFEVSADLFDHYTKEVVPISIVQRPDAENVIISGVYQAHESYQRMRLRVHISPVLSVSASAPSLPGMALKPGFTNWSKVGYLENPKTGKSELGYSQETYMYRYQPIERDE